VTISWDIPGDAVAGTYRISYLGDARDEGGVVRAFTGTSPTFVVTA
jgi:hypothetical protein